MANQQQALSFVSLIRDIFIVPKMSTEKLKELKLYKKLEKDLTYRQKLQEKIRQISSHPQSQSSQLSKKLNNNKKYFQQEERNAEIERQNRILFQKIQSQGMKSHYFNNVKHKYRSSKTLDSMEDDENQRHHRKYNNFSQNKIHYQQQEQSRISFQQNQQLMKPKPKKPSQKLITELSPEVLEIFRSRMIENKVQNQETILFQGIAEIDSIRFKVKIFIKDKTYCLSGKNKHTEIMLKMELSEYKKFHRQVLFGNPSSIFQFLVIDKGKIRFRTLEEEQEAEYLKQQKIYKIHEEQDEQNYERKKKEKSSRKSSNHFQRSGKQQYKFLEQKMVRPSVNEEQSRTEEEVFEGISVPLRYYKNEGSKSREKKKENVLSNINKKKKGESHEKYKTLEEYINERPDLGMGKKDLRSGESTEVEVRNMKNRYKLPYI